MSKTVDERVVEMRFDNKQFESNVQTSLNTLDKLKQKLNLSSASKGLENINSAAKKVNMNGLGNAVDTVRMRFSALEVMGVTALANITNSAVNAGKRMVSALTIDPIKTGFQEYETQINAVQTILANTQHAGTTLNDVTKALDELNTYADKTIYNFTEMTRNIGTFTAAGVDLNTSVTAIQGIANLAAVSGSTSQQASVAMYQLSQALSSGTVKLMDWNSVVNAGMGGKVFQDALMETARVHGIAIDSMIDKNGSFRETLSEGWLTSEILTETLEKFTMTTEGLTEAEIEANREKLRGIGYTEEQIDEIFKLGEMSTNAATKVKTFTQLWDVLKESAQSGWTKTWQLIIGDFEEAKSLLTSLSDVFTGLINRMSDARNQLLESALGMGFDKLKKTVSTALEPIETVAETVEDVTVSLEDLGSVVDKVILGDFGNGKERFDKLTAAGQNYYRVQNKINETLGNSHRYTKEQIEAQDKILAGQKKTNEETKKTEKATTKLTTAQKDQLKKMVKMTEEQAKAAGYTKEQIKALNELRITAEKLGMPLDKFIDNLDEINGRWLLINSFKNIGESIAEVFRSMAKAFRAVFDPIKPQQLFDAIAAFHKFTSEMIMSEETAGKLQRVFQGVFAAIDLVTKVLGGGLKIAFTVLSTICKAFGTTLLDVAANVGDLIYKFNEWIEQHSFISDFVEMLAEKIPPIVDKIKEFVKALWVDSGAAENFTKIATALESVWNVVYGQFKLGLNSGIKLLTSVLALFGTNLGEILGKVSDWIVAIADWIDKNTLLSGGLKKISNIIATVVTGIVNCAKAFVALEPVQKLIEKIKDAFSKLSDILSFDFNGGAIESLYNWISKTFAKIEEWINSLGSSEAFQAGLDIVAGLAEGIASGAGKAINAIVDIGKSIIAAICGVLGIHSPSTVMIGIGIFIILGLIQGLISGENALYHALVSIFGNVLDVIVDFFQNGFPYAIDVAKTMLKRMGDTIKENEIDWSAIFVAGTIAAAAFLMYKLIKVLEKFAKPLSSFKNLFDTLGKSLTELGKAKRLELYSRGILNIAISIGILAAALYLLTLPDYGKLNNKLWNAVAAIVVMAGVLGILGAVITKLNLNTWEGTAGILGLSAFLLSLGGAMLMVSKAINNIADLDKEAIYKFIAVLASVTAALVTIMGMSLIMKSIGSMTNIYQLGILFTSIASSLMILSFAMKAIAALSDTDIQKGMMFIAGVTFFFTALVAVSKFAGEHASRAGTMLLKMGIAIGILALTIKLISSISVGDIAKGVVTIGAIMYLFGMVVVASYFAGEHANRAGTMFFRMAVAIGILALAMKLIGTMSIQEIERGLVVIALVEVLFAAFIAVTRIFGFGDVKRVGTMLFGMAAAIGILAVSIRLLAGVSIGDITKGFVTIALMEAMFIVIIRVSEFAGKHADKAGAMLLKMSLAILILVGAIALLSLLKPEKVILGTACISAMLGMFALLVRMTKYSKHAGNLMKTLIVMAVVIGILGGVLITLSCLDPKNVAVATVAITSMLGMLTALMYVTKYAGKVSLTIFVIVGVVYLLAKILRMVADLPVASTLAAAGGLSILLLAMTGALTIASLMGPKALLGAVALLAMVGVMALLAKVLKLMNDLDVVPSMETAKALSVLLLGMSAACIILGIVGVIGPAAIFGAVVLAGVIGALGAFIAAVGLISKKIPELEEFLNAGIPIIQKIGYAIGSFFGNIATGFSSELPDVATNLSEFMSNLQPFIDGASSIKGDVVDNIRGLSAAILLLTSADFLSNINSFLFGMDGEDTAFADFGSELESFGESLSKFAKATEGIDPDKLGPTVESMGKIIEAAGNIPNQGGKLAELVGDNTLSEFGPQLAEFGEYMKKYSDAVDGVDPKKITSSANAAKALAEVADSLPNEGGALSALLGDNTLTEFGPQLVPFGEALKDYSVAVDGIKPEAIYKSADAAKALTEVIDSIPNQGGALGALVGDNTFGKLAPELIRFGLAMKLYSNSVTGINTSAITESVGAAKGLVEIINSMPNQGGMVSWFTGDNTLGKLGDQLPEFGDAMKTYSEAVAGINKEAMTSSVSAARSITNLLKTLPKDGLGDGLDGFSDGASDLGTALKTYSDKVADVDTGAINKTVTATNKLVDMINDMAGINTGGVSKFKSAIGSLAETNMSGFVATFKGASSSMATAGSGFIDSLTQGMKASSGKLSASASSIMNSVTKSFTSAAKSLNKAGVNMITNLVKGFKSRASSLRSAVTRVATSAASGARAGYSGFYSSGSYLVQGFAKGIRGSVYLATAAAKYAAKKAKEAIDNALNSHSPARELIPSGVNFILGFTKGIYDSLSYVRDASSTAANYAIDTMSDSIRKMSTVFSMDIDANPTIRPVVDLSSVESGANRINDLLNTDSSIGVMSNLNSINNMMNRRNQNGINDDVVSAIDKLRNDLGNMNNTTYSINGVTYDDGSNIADAVKAIVRAARVERRV